MKKKIMAACLALVFAAPRAQTIEECQEAAVRNYPLIRQQELIAKTTELTLSNIRKNWLPQVSASAQATYQSDVTSWPEGIKALMGGMGVDMKGLRKDQYRIGIDVQQTIYDGGATGSQQDVARQQGNVMAAQNKVDIYNVRRRVNEMYFGILLLQSQIELSKDLQQLLAGNERKLASMVKAGTAAESDLNNVRAERLGAAQRQTDLESQEKALRTVLSTFCGMEIKDVSKPAAAATEQAGSRPELRLFDEQLKLAETQQKALNSALRPRLSVFAQGFYGYPGYNLFEDMTRHEWSLNGMVGARLSWNIGALYTRKNDVRKLKLQREMTESSRDLFLLQQRMDVQQQDENMERYRKLADADGEIVALRQAVRKAAESKLQHGIIDANDLVREINQENAARQQQSIHEILLLKEIYDRKFTTND